MPDAFNVTATTDKPSYTPGQTITVTIAGGAVQTTTSSSTLSGTINLTAADGTTTTIPLGGAVVQTVTATPQSVKISSITDSTGRVWTVAPTGLSATATA